MQNDLVLYSAEYTTAYKDMVETILRGFAKAHPMLQKVSFFTTEHAGPTIYPNSPQPLEHEMERVETIATFNVDRRQPDIDAHTEGLALLAEAYRDNMLRQLFGRIGEVCEAHGNVIDQQGRPVTWDVMLDMLECVPFSFDDQGHMLWPSIVASPAVSGQIDRLLRETERTPEQERRFQDIQRRQRGD